MSYAAPTGPRPQSTGLITITIQFRYKAEEREGTNW
jgi:hypothetical protein